MKPKPEANNPKAPTGVLVQPVVMTTGTIPHQELPPMIPPAWTVHEVLHHIPEEWRNATICLLDGLGRPYPVKRVVLAVNHNGSKVVMLGPDEQKMCKWS